MSSASLHALRRQLDEVVERDRPAQPALPTGVAALDAVLPGGGLPRGRLTELLGRPGSGRTTLLRQVVEHLVLAGTWVAYVDATRTLSPRDWAALGHREELWVVRPRDAQRGAWCTDVLLRSGAFGLVVLDGAPPLSRAVAIRLTRLAQDGGAALVVLGAAEQGATMLGGALRMRVGQETGDRRQKPEARRGHTPLPSPGHPERAQLPGCHPERAQRVEGSSVTGFVAGLAATDRRSLDGAAFRTAPLGMAAQGDGAGSPARYTPHAARQPPDQREPEGGRAAARTIRVTVEKGGSHQQPVEVSCAIGVARRLCTHPEVPDRRGVAVRRGGATRADGSTGSAALAPAGARGGAAIRTHGRRFAESDFGRIQLPSALG
jgi:hypothetical protein